VWKTLWISFRVTRSIIDRIKPLFDVGLGYVQLGQSSSTLSGGEAQRVKLASFLIRENSNGHIFFIFDEPTTGLHFHDINKLLRAMNALVEKGHSVLVVEHNLEVIKSADWVVDLGPEGGQAGGNLVFEGTPEETGICERKSHRKVSGRETGVVYAALAVFRRCSIHPVAMLVLLPESAAPCTCRKLNVVASRRLRRVRPASGGRRSNP
jgi:ABC-type multidrug transport system ATPase subunit